MIQFGYGGSGTSRFLPIVIEHNGTLIFNGRFNAGGIQLCTVGENSVIEFGEDITITGESHILASKKIQIGNDCIISWNTQIMDTDFYKVFVNGTIANPDKEICIGNHVWVSSGSSIMKGSQIPDGCIVAAGSQINSRNIFECNCIITGVPNKIIAQDIHWGR